MTGPVFVCNPASVFSAPRGITGEAQTAASARHTLKRAHVQWRASASGGSSSPTPASPPPVSRPAVARLAAAVLTMVVRGLADDVRGLDIDVDCLNNGDALRGRLRGVTLRATRLVLFGAAASGGVAARLPALDMGTVGRVPFAVSWRATVTQVDLNLRKGVWFVALESLLRDVVKLSVSTAMGRNGVSGAESVVTELERVELQPAADRPGSTGGAAAGAAAFFASALWNMVAPRVTPSPSSGKLALHARTTLADGTVLRYSVRSRMSLSDEGTLVEFDQPELMWRGMGLPLLAVARASIKLSEETVIVDLTRARMTPRRARSSSGTQLPRAAGMTDRRPRTKTRED
jgi:hypothetical protein